MNRVASRLGYSRWWAVGAFDWWEVFAPPSRASAHVHDPDRGLELRPHQSAVVSIARVLSGTSEETLDDDNEYPEEFYQVTVDPDQVRKKFTDACRD